MLFWNDPDGEFSETVDELSLEGIHLVRVDKVSAFRVKMEIEAAPLDRWLLYSTQAEPDPAGDWLLDLRLRAKEFRADATSMLLEDLGLTTQSLRSHLKHRARFFRARDRVERLRRLVAPSDDAEELDRKMLAVAVRAETGDFHATLLKLFAGMVREGQADLDAEPRGWQEIVANELGAAFWGFAGLEFGYRPEAGQGDPSLRDLLLRLLVTDFARALAGSAPGAWTHLILPKRALAANVTVFMARWRSDLAYFGSYGVLSGAIASELGLEEVLAGLSAEQLLGVMTFAQAERRIIQDLKDRVLAGEALGAEALQPIIARRRDGHWANRLLVQTSEES
ncbi:MAG: BREX-1 system phosphatase PglZ type A, partial [Opitutales bacterium]